MELQNIISDRAATTVEFMGEKLDLKYRPGVVTAEAIERVQSGLGASELADFYVQLIAEWGLTRNGVNLPIDAATISALPIQLLRAIMAKVMEEVPQGEAGRRSNGS